MDVKAGIELHRHATPYIAGVVIAVIAVMFWRAILIVEDRGAHQQARTAAVAVARQIAAAMQTRTQALDGMARRWVQRGRTPEDEWRLDARRYIEEQPGYQAIVWVDATGRTRWIEPPAGLETSLNLDFTGDSPLGTTMAAARDQDRIRVSPPLELAQGAAGFLAFAPIRAAQKFDGFILGVYRFGPFLDHVSRDLAPGYLVSIYQDRRELYRRDLDERNAAIVDWTEGQDLDVDGSRWTVRVHPGRGVLTESGSALSTVVLLGGLVLACLATFSLRAGQTARIRAAELDVANMALAELNRSLDQRAEQRTAELGESRRAAVSVAQDADEARRRAEDTAEALARVNQELRHRTDEMEQFVYTVSHDLKSPVVTMIGFLSMLKEDLTAGKIDDARDALQHVNGAAERMGQLIRDLLELSRIGRVVAKPERVDTAQLLGQLGETLRLQLDQCRAELHIQPDMPVVLVDRMRLSQVFENLISNAIKYGCNGDVRRIEVGGRTDRGEVRFFVRDHGPGIARQYHEKIFGLFQRLHNDKRGTGVGLAIVARVAQVHGGRAWVESEPGNGATFWLALPARLAVRTQEALATTG